MFGSRRTLYTTIGGALFLCLFSILQKFLSGFPIRLGGFIVPAIYGGLTGLIIGWQFERLSNSEARLKLMIDKSRDWEYLQQLDGSLVCSSPSCQEITGYPPEMFIANQSFLDEIVHPDDRPLWEEHKCNSRENPDGIVPIEFRIMRKNGEICWISHVCRHIPANGGPHLIRGSNRDITAARNLQQELKKLRALLPICAGCKKIRDSGGIWTPLETYITDRFDAQFTHGICPDCAQIYQQEME